MNEASKTLTFVGVSVAALVAAVLMRPQAARQSDVFADLNKPFYEEFEPAQAAQLRVVTFNEDTATSKIFSVALKKEAVDGKEVSRWVIPSHLDYPADGKDRLAKTATSVLGIKREEFRTNNPDQYAELGVVDPEEADTSKLKGRGQRLTITAGDNKVLADYIIGKQVKSRPGFYYVRRPTDKSVFVAKLSSIDLSTKFADWIEADLLQIQADQLSDITVHKYTVNKSEGKIENEEVLKLHRDKSADPWKLEGLDEAKEEVNADEVRKMVDSLDDMRIVGVRRKPEGLSRDLKLNKGIKLSPTIYADLMDKGFIFSQEGLIAAEGEMFVSTDAGTGYVLYFGEIFSASEEEAESGIEKDNADAKSEEKEKAGAKKDAAAKKEDDKKKSLVDSRYLFVTAFLDKKALGPKPVPPEEPGEAPAEEPAEEPKTPEEKPDAEKPDAEKPDAEKGDAEKGEGEKPAEPKKEAPADAPKPEGDQPAEEKADGAQADESANNEAAEPAKPEEAPAAEKKEEPADPAKPEAEKPEAEKPETEKSETEKPAEPAQPGEEKPAAEKPAAEEPEETEKPEPVDPKKAYEEAKKKYDADLAAYNEKVKKAQEKVDELNARFADWYYVISADSFNKLRQGRATLVKEKKVEPKPGETPAEPNPAEPKPEPEPEKPEGDAPEDKKPEEAKPEEKTPEDKKPDEKKPDDAPPEEKKPEGDAKDPAAKPDEKAPE